jgi:hypothetical protein
VVAIGCQSSQLIFSSFRDTLYQEMITPRCGFLVELPYPSGAAALRHGIMEASYALHYRDSDLPNAATDMDITFTASSSCTGTLLLGALYGD